MILLLACSTPEAPPALLPSESLYNADLPLEGPSGPTTFAHWRGQPTLAALFYSSCRGVCPMIVSRMKAVDEKAGPEADLRFLLVSMDLPADTPAALAATRDANHLDERWLLATPRSEGDLRTIAALLDLRYRRLPDGGFDHSGTIVLLDAEGRILARDDGTASEALVAALRPVP